MEFASQKQLKKTQKTLTLYPNMKNYMYFCTEKYYI